MQTPFYHFMVEMKPKVEVIAPELKYLEVIAFLQEQWEQLGTEQKKKYDLKVAEKKRESKMASKSSSID